MCQNVTIKGACGKHYVPATKRCKKSKDLDRECADVNEKPHGGRARELDFQYGCPHCKLDVGEQPDASTYTQKNDSSHVTSDDITMTPDEDGPHTPHTPRKQERVPSPYWEGDRAGPSRRRTASPERYSKPQSSRKEPPRTPPTREPSQSAKGKGKQREREASTWRYEDTSPYDRAERETPRGTNRGSLFQQEQDRETRQRWEQEERRKAEFRAGLHQREVEARQRSEQERLAKERIDRAKREAEARRPRPASQSSQPSSPQGQRPKPAQPTAATRPSLARGATLPTRPSQSPRVSHWSTSWVQSSPKSGPPKVVRTDNIPRIPPIKPLTPLTPLTSLAPPGQPTSPPQHRTTPASQPRTPTQERERTTTSRTPVSSRPAERGPVSPSTSKDDSGRRRRRRRRSYRSGDKSSSDSDQGFRSPFFVRT